MLLLKFDISFLSLSLKLLFSISKRKEDPKFVAQYKNYNSILSISVISFLLMKQLISLSESFKNTLSHSIFLILLLLNPSYTLLILIDLKKSKLMVSICDWFLF